MDAEVKQGNNPPQEIDRGEEETIPKDSTTIAGISNESHDNGLPFTATSLSPPNASLRSTLVSAQTSSLVSDYLKAKKEFETVSQSSRSPGEDAAIPRYGYRRKNHVLGKSLPDLQ